MFTLKIEGKDKVIASMKSAINNMAASSVEELRREADELLADAREEVPVDTGALHDSGKVTGDAGSVFIGPKSVEFVVSFGGGDVDYAVYVHEDLTKRHTFGKAKYLEDPFNRRVRGLLGRLASGVRAR